jgi:hypothetical protein
MPDNITTQELQDALNRLTDAINDASGITRPINMLGQASSSAASQVNTFAANLGQGNQAAKVSI